MSITMDEEIKRWTALRKAALVLEIVQGKTMVAEAAGSLTCSPPRSRNESTRARRGLRRPARQAGRCPRAVRATAEGPTGGLRRGHAGAARTKKLASLLGKDET